MPSLFDLLEQRLKEHYASTLPQNVGYQGAVKNAILGGINLPFEAGRHIGGDITGSLYAMSAQDTRATNPLDARIAAAYDRGGPAAAFEAAKTDPRKEVSLTAGAIGMLTDPTMLVGGPLGKLGKVGEIADTVLSTPFKPLEVALGQVGRRAIAPAVLRARQALYGPVEGVAGNVPKSAGLIGPVPPPPLRAPPPLEPAAAPSIIDLARGAPIRPAVPKITPLPEGLAPTRTPSITGLARQRGRAAEAEIAQRVTPAQERAAANVESLAPEVSVAPGPPTAPTRGISEGAAPAADRAAALAGFSGRDTNTLLNVAYDHPKAVANAQAKYPDVGALRARAIERIQLDAGRVRRLAAADPDLAARVAALPDVKGGNIPVSPPPTPGGDLTAAQAAYEAAATPEAKLAAERQFVDAYQGAGAAAPAEQVAREAPAEGNRGQDLFAQLRQEAAPLGEGAVPPDQLAAINRLVEYHPSTGTNEDRALYGALRAEALRRGIPERAIAQAEAAIPDTLRRQFMESPQLIRERIAEIEASPEGRTFKYINPQGQFKLVDIRTGRPIALRGTGGQLRQSAEAPWNIPGTHYDEVAASALDRRLGPDAVDTTNLDDFFGRARELWQERRQLREQLRAKSTGSFTETAGMGGYAPIMHAVFGGLGAGVGGAIGAATDPEDRARGFTKGAAIGALAGAGAPAFPEIARALGPGASEAAGRALSNLGTTGGDIRAAFGAGRTAMREAGQAEAQGVSTAAQAEAAGLGHYVSGPRGAGKAVGDFLNQQRSVIVATPKNQLLDVAHTRGMLHEYAPKGADPAGTMDTIADELRTNEAAPDAYARLSDSLRSAQERWGFDGYTPDLGQGQVGALAQEEAGRILPAAQRVINGTLMELRTKGPVGLLTFPVGGLRGYLQPFTDAFFQRLNRLPQRAGRETLYTLTGDANSFLAAHNFLGNLAQRGVDVTTLAGRRFTPEDVEALAGTQAANEWRSLLATVWGGAEAETKRVLGDFGQKTALEKVPLIGRMFWLAGWSQRMLPVYAQVAARHPGVSMAVGGALANQAQGLKAQGLNPWDVGGVDTPLGRVNLLSPMPFSGELAGEALSSLGGQEGEAKTPYQTFEGIAGGLGLPINPLVGTAAYIAGQSPRRPGDLDRYAGVENAVLPGPDVGLDYGAMLDKARQIVTGLGEGDLAAGKKPPASEADKEFARLVFDRTGLPLSDPRNIGAVIDSLADDPNTLAAKWRKEAEENVAGRQGKQGVVSAVSPLTISRIDPLARQANIGRTNQPYSYQQISAAYDAGNKKQARAMQAANTASKAPDQRVYDAASEAQRLGLVKGFLAQQQAARRVQVSGDPYGLHNRPHGAGLP